MFVILSVSEKIYTTAVIVELSLESNPAGIAKRKPQQKNPQNLRHNAKFMDCHEFALAKTLAMTGKFVAYFGEFAKI